MRFLTSLFISIILLTGIDAIAQKKSGRISGKVVDENDAPLSKVSVMILGRQSGITTSDSGTFSLTVPAERADSASFQFFRVYD